MSDRFFWAARVAKREPRVLFEHRMTLVDRMPRNGSMPGASCMLGFGRRVIVPTQSSSQAVHFGIGVALLRS